MFVYGPGRLVNLMGITNGYILTFLVAVFGGISALSSTSFYFFEITLVLGGLNPYIVGILGGLGLSVGDSFFFLLGNKGREVIEHYKRSKLGRFSKWLSRRPNWIIPFIAFIYSGMTPFPNDVLMVGAAIADIKYKKIIIPIILGNIFLTTVIALLALRGIIFIT